VVAGAFLKLLAPILNGGFFCIFHGTVAGMGISLQSKKAIAFRNQPPQKRVKIKG
jgi:hypothetical protein